MNLYYFQHKEIKIWFVKLKCFFFNEKPGLTVSFLLCYDTIQYWENNIHIFFVFYTIISFAFSFLHKKMISKMFEPFVFLIQNCDRLWHQYICIDAGSYMYLTCFCLKLSYLKNNRRQWNLLCKYLVIFM